MQTDISAYLNDMGFSPDSKAADPGTPGGMATIGSEETIQYHKVMKALSGVTGGLESMRVENGMLFGRVTGIDEELNLTSILHYDPGTIIDTKKIAQEAIDKSGIFNKNGQPINMYLDKAKAKTVLTEDGSSSYNVVPYKQKLLFNDIMRNISASGEAILANTKDYNSINAWWLNNAGKDNDFKLNFVTTQDGGKVLDDESKQKWLAKYEEQAKSLIPNYTVVTEDNAKELGMEVGTEFIDTQAAETGLSKVTKPTSPKDPEWKITAQNDTVSLFNNPVQFVNKYLQEGESAKMVDGKVIITTQGEEEGDDPSTATYNLSNASDWFKFARTYIRDGDSENAMNYSNQFQRSVQKIIDDRKNKLAKEDQVYNNYLKWREENKELLDKQAAQRKQPGVEKYGIEYLTNQGIEIIDVKIPEQFKNAHKKFVLTNINNNAGNNA